MYKKFSAAHISVWRLCTLFCVNLLDFGGSCGRCPTSYITRGGDSQVKIKKKTKWKTCFKTFKKFRKNFVVCDWGKANTKYENQHTIYTSHIFLYKGLKNLRFSEKNANVGNNRKGKKRIESCGFIYDTHILEIIKLK